MSYGTARRRGTNRDQNKLFEEDLGVHRWAEIATAPGYEVVGIDLFRTRTATATKEELREEVVLLRWPGSDSTPGMN